MLATAAPVAWADGEAPAAGSRPGEGRLRESSRVCVETARATCAVRPRALGYGAHAFIYGIRWQSWGGRRIVGRGHILWPATAMEPRFGPYPAKVILSGQAECGTEIYYSLRTVKYRSDGHWQTPERNEGFGPCYVWPQRPTT